MLIISATADSLRWPTRRAEGSFQLVGVSAGGADDAGVGVAGGFEAIEEVLCTGAGG